MPTCPGQNTAHWKPGDIFEVPCVACGTPVEFFKDDSSRKCSGCGLRFRNPRLDVGCAQWCPYAEQCQTEQKSAARKTEKRPDA